MKSTAEASSGCSIQAFQISPVVTGTEVSRLTRWILRISSLDGLVAAVDRLVADHDAVDVAVLAREIDRRRESRARCARSFLSIQAPTETRRPNSWAIVGHELGAAGRRIGADLPGVGRDRLEIGADLLGDARSGRCRDGPSRRTACRTRWRAGRRRRGPGNVRGTAPRDRHARKRQRADKSDEAHQSNQVGLELFDANPSPGWASRCEAAYLEERSSNCISRSWRIDDGTRPSRCRTLLRCCR